MPKTNKHLIEVNCSFQFLEETTVWDSTFFGQFYEKIKPLGFDEKQERKGVQITFDGSKGLANMVSSPTMIDDQVLFFNQDKSIAIALAKQKISFHWLKDYTSWEDFMQKVVKPNFQLYQGLGLGNGKRQCSIVYLNRFENPITEMLSEYFTIVSHLEKTSFGNEIATFVQRVFTNENYLLIAKLNTTIQNDICVSNLECGSICNNEQLMSSIDWFKQTEVLHEPLKSFFEATITEKLKSKD
jgi:uncharacterized protein (TIGR04255 family)